MFKIAKQKCEKMNAHNYRLEKRNTKLCLNYVKTINIIHLLFALKEIMF